MIHKEEYISEGEYCLINPQDIVGNKVSYDKISRISKKTAERLDTYKLEENDIVIARRGDLSKCAIITENDEKCLCGTGSFFIRLKSNKIYPKLLFLTIILAEKGYHGRGLGALPPRCFMMGFAIQKIVVTLPL